MKRKMMMFLAVLLFIAGIALLLFPKASDLYFQKNANDLIKKYEINMCDGDSSNGELRNKLGTYNRDLYINHQMNLKDPWSYQLPGFDLHEYGFTENIIGSIEIEKIDVHLPVYLGSSAENLKKGATLMTETSIPIGGENTNAVIAAHRGMMNARMFRDLDDLEKGDSVVMHTFCDTLMYEVVNKVIIDANDIDKILIQDNKDMITLISCEGKNDLQRIVVYCERI